MALKVGIIGAGAVGSRVARQLLVGDPNARVVMTDSDEERLRSSLGSLGTRATPGGADMSGEGLHLLVVAAPCGNHVEPIVSALNSGLSAISTSDRPDEVAKLLALDSLAKQRGALVLAGVGFTPGMSCVLAAYGAARFDRVDEIHVARVGTGGPACARQHHRALKGAARDWRDGEWVRRPGGSGRELVWFPDPVGGADCYRGALPDSLLLQRCFPSCDRITARVAATRQDRFTSWLPMLSPPHPEGGVGALRVELRGRIDTRREIQVFGAVERPAIGAAAVVAAAASWLGESPVQLTGAMGLAGSVDPRSFLREVAARGVTAQEFEGHSAL